MIETKYCFHHGGLAPAETGDYKVSGNPPRKRWVCRTCSQKAVKVKKNPGKWTERNIRYMSRYYG